MAICFEFASRYCCFQYCLKGCQHPCYYKCYYQYQPSNHSKSLLASVHYFKNYSSTKCVSKYSSLSNLIIRWSYLLFFRLFFSLQTGWAIIVTKMISQLCHRSICPLWPLSSSQLIERGRLNWIQFNWSQFNFANFISCISAKS